LPRRLRPLFWEYDFARLRWTKDADLIMGRILMSGDWEAMQWLRRRVAPSALREWIQRRRGRGLSARQLRFWELILGLPRREVNDWLRDPARRLWEERQQA
jgi:hypothetical protein